MRYGPLYPLMEPKTSPSGPYNSFACLLHNKVENTFHCSRLFRFLYVGVPSFVGFYNFIISPALSLESVSIWVDNGGRIKGRKPAAVASNHHRFLVQENRGPAADGTSFVPAMFNLPFNIQATDLDRKLYTRYSDLSQI